MSDNSKALGARVRDVRAAQNISQEAASNAIGVSQATYSRVESGDRPLKGDELVLLADFLGVRANALVGVAELTEQLPTAARSTAEGAPADRMFQKLLSYVEVDRYLAAHGIG